MTFSFICFLFLLILGMNGETKGGEVLGFVQRNWEAFGRG